MENRSEEIDKLASALSKAQGAMSAANKDTVNPFFKSKYADLSSCWSAARAALSTNGLSVVQLPSMDAEKITCETILLHSSGQWVSSVMEMSPVKKDPQGIGSCLTYLRRYSFCAIVGISQEDDDGNASSEKQTDKAKPELKISKSTSSENKNQKLEQKSENKGPAKISAPQKRMLESLIARSGLNRDDVKSTMGVDSLFDLKMPDMDRVLKMISENTQREPGAEG